MASQSPPTRPIALVVEDEPLLRLLAVDIAQDAGFEAIDVDNAEDACGILESRSDIRVVFTDINLPGSMDGLKLAAAVRDRWPPVQVIVTSGMVKPDAGALPPGARFFAKPYPIEEIADVLRQSLRTGPSR